MKKLYSIALLASILVVLVIVFKVHYSQRGVSETKGVQVQEDRFNGEDRSKYIESGTGNGASTSAGATPANSQAEARNSQKKLVSNGYINADGVYRPAIDTSQPNPDLEKLIESGKVVIEKSTASSSPMPGQKYYKADGYKLILGTIDSNGNFVPCTDTSENFDLSKGQFTSLHYPILSGASKPTTQIIVEPDGSKIEVIYEQGKPPQYRKAD